MGFYGCGHEQERVLPGAREVDDLAERMRSPGTCWRSERIRPC